MSHSELPLSTGQTFTEPQADGAGWYRLAAGFASLAAIQLAWMVWQALNSQAVTERVMVSWYASGFLVSAALCLTAAVLAARRHGVATAGFIALAYVATATPFYTHGAKPPGLGWFPMIALFALIGAAGQRRRAARSSA